ncbi:hypothetical protein OG453_30460 [Streptomyces sp. NBC_01381]|uniref:hypothetical protein n=1 Tax=Streptomyces sp. NBC_01381 TaxID=2903845 RepID=UPI002252909C|nr:hypothetical protein [Streptomyces sp. NBC_01381]MCX4670968.1 hypothetical protein [Streptomyces sp. NBC_01381]
MTAEVSWGDAATDPDVVELHAEIARLRRALAGRAVIDQAPGMMMAAVRCGVCTQQNAYDIRAESAPTSS